jgi:hypothetical protein
MAYLPALNSKRSASCKLLKISQTKPSGIANSRFFCDSVKGLREVGERAKRQIFLKRNLLIFRDRIFDSKVEGGILSWAAAPDGPETRPPAAANAVSIASFS